MGYPITLDTPTVSAGARTLLEADESLVEVPVEAASSGGTGTSGWNYARYAGVIGT
jgi:hypothetical protein